MTVPSGFEPMWRDDDAPHQIRLMQQSKGRFNEVGCTCGASLATVRPEDGPEAALAPFRAHRLETLP